MMKIEQSRQEATEALAKNGESEETRIDIERLETEAPTHDHPAISLRKEKTDRTQSDSTSKARREL